MYMIDVVEVLGEDGFDLSVGGLSRMERGNRAITVETLQVLARTYDVPLSVLVTEDGIFRERELVPA